MFPSAISATAAAVAPSTAPRLRGYQIDLKRAANESWAMGNKNVLAVAPTGGGKTVFFADMIHDHVGYSCVIAHRQELVGQISLALARAGVRHRIIAPEPLVKAIVSSHLEELGKTWYDPTAPCAVAGVDTLVRRASQLTRFIGQVTLWVMDEAHHVLKDNKWGKAVELFPNAKGLGVSATPERADRKGLGRTTDGLFDHMVVGPGMRQLIDWGYLTDYRIICAPTHIAGLEQYVSKTTGDYVVDRGKGKDAVRGSSIIGDVVDTYRKWALGKLAVVFASDVDTARDMAVKFKQAGIPAEHVDAKTPDDLRRSILKRFKRREVHVLVNVDLFGEGFDLPAIEVVIMARPTMSFAVYAQQFGRALRLMIPAEWMRVWDDYPPEQRLQLIAQSAKPKALIIDHVGNVTSDEFRGPPDLRLVWSLDGAEKRTRGGSDEMPLTYCVNPDCGAPYERFKTRCPDCGHKPETAEGGRTLEQVDGDLHEVDPAIWEALRAEAAQLMQPLEAFREQQQMAGIPGQWVMANVKRKAEHQAQARDLFDAMAWWGGERRAAGETDAELMKRFYLTFGVDWATAQTLDREAMAKLSARIDEKLTAASSAARVRLSA